MNKYQVAKQYMREYNQKIKIVRLDPRNRHERLMTMYEALEYVEDVIFEYVKNIDN